MHFTTYMGLAAAGIASTSAAVSSGFNYGSVMSDGYTPITEDEYAAQFARAKTLQGTDGEFTSARIYTMIQAGTTDSPSDAIQAAINTKTTLLLGLWASIPEDQFQNELSALSSAIQQYGTDFTDLVVGISVGSEDLYRDSPTGIQNNSTIGASPEQLVNYIEQTRSVIKGTGLSDAKIGHVDTWTAYVNSSNEAVIEAIDWLGVDSYPYFQNTVPNTIGDSYKVFWNSYDSTQKVSKGKEVWVTETGWPVSGPESGEAVASVSNAETYWQEVACSLIGKYNTWYYTLQDALPTTPSPSFGIIGSNLNSAPLYDLKCKKTSSTSDPPSASGGPKSNGTTSSGGSSSSSSNGGPASSASASSTAQPNGSGSNSASTTGAAACAGILAIFALMAAL